MARDGLASQRPDLMVRRRHPIPPAFMPRRQEARFRGPMLGQAQAPLKQTSLVYRNKVMIRKYPELIAIALLIALTIIHVVHYELTLTDVIIAPSLPAGALTMAQSKSIDTTLEVSHLMIGWALAIIGATGFFTKLNIERNIPLRRGDLFASAIIVISSVVSLYYGHLGIHKVSEMLSLGQFPVGSTATREIFARQYIAVLAATGLFGFHVILFCWRLVRR